MKRREFIAAAGSAALSFAGPSFSQTSSTLLPKRLAIFSLAEKPENMTVLGSRPYKAYFGELNRRGFLEGRNITVERYSLLGQPERQAEIAREIVSGQPDLIVATGGPLARQLKPLTTTIPIVAISSDPVAGKIVTNLARPEGNITGVAVDAGTEVWGKRIALLRDTTQKLSKMQFLLPASARPFWEMAIEEPVREAAARMSVSVSLAVVTGNLAGDYERAFQFLEKERPDGLGISEAAENYPHRQLIVDLAAQHNLPAIYTYREYAEIGGLLSYGVDIPDAYRRMAEMTAEIWRGAKPADIPYYQQTKIELVLNLKTAKSLGLEFPATLMAGATEVIE